MITQDEALQLAREANRWAANQTDDSYDYPQIRDERLAQAAYQRGLSDAEAACDAIARKHQAAHDPQAENIADECGDTIRAAKSAPSGMHPEYLRGLEDAAKVCDDMARAVSNNNFVAIDNRKLCAKEIRALGSKQ